MFCLAKAAVAGCESRLGEPVNVQNDLINKTDRVVPLRRKTGDLLILRTVGMAPFHDLTVPPVSLIPAVLYDLYRPPTVFPQSSKKSRIVRITETDCTYTALVL